MADTEMGSPSMGLPPVCLFPVIAPCPPVFGASVARSELFSNICFSFFQK